MTNKPNLRWAKLVLNSYLVKPYGDNGGFCLRENKANRRGRRALWETRPIGASGSLGGGRWRPADLDLGGGSFHCRGRGVGIECRWSWATLRRGPEVVVRMAIGVWR